MRVTVLRNPISVLESYRQPLREAIRHGRQSAEVYQTLTALAFDWGTEMGKGRLSGEIQALLIPIWDNAVLMDYHGDGLINNFIAEAEMRTMSHAQTSTSGAYPARRNLTPEEAPHKFTPEEQNNLHFLYSGILIAVVALAAFLFNYAGDR